MGDNTLMNSIWPGLQEISQGGRWYLDENFQFWKCFFAYSVCANFYLNAHGLGNSNFFIIFSILWLVGWWKSLESLYVWRGLLFGFEGGGGGGVPIANNMNRPPPTTTSGSQLCTFLSYSWMAQWKNCASEVLQVVAVSYTCPALIEEEHHREKTTEEHITPEFNAT